MVDGVDQAAWACWSVGWLVGWTQEDAQADTRGWFVGWQPCESLTGVVGWSVSTKAGRPKKHDKTGYQTQDARYCNTGIRRARVRQACKLR